MELIKSLEDIEVDDFVMVVYNFTDGTSFESLEKVKDIKQYEGGLVYASDLYNKRSKQWSPCHYHYSYDPKDDDESIKIYKLNVEDVIGEII